MSIPLYSNFEQSLDNCLKAHEAAKEKAIIPHQSTFYAGGAIPTDWNLEGYLQAYGNIGWLYAVVFRIALGCSEVEWTLFDVTNQDKPKQIYKHPVLSLLHQVNPFQTSNEFIALDTIYNELLGESFWALNFNALNEPAEIILPYPHKMSVVPAKAFPFVKGYVYGTGATAIPFDVNEIIHFKYPNPLNQYRGLAPAKAIGVNLSAEQNADKWVNQFFYNSARVDGYIQYDYNLSDEQFEKLRKTWYQNYKGVNKAHQIGLIEGGGKFIQIQNSIKDMDFPNLKQKNRDVILGVFGMPQSVMGISENVNKANAEAGDYTFARWIVKPRLDWKKAKIQEQLIPKFRRSENLQIGFTEVVPETIEQKIAIAESGLRAGYKTVNEARIVVGDDPLPPEVGDVLLIPLNLIPTSITKPIQPPSALMGEPLSEELTEENFEPEGEINQESYKGGEGSGHFDHAGRPGEVGGSAPGGGGEGGGGKPSGGGGGGKPLERFNISDDSFNFETTDDDFHKIGKEKKKESIIKKSYQRGQEMSEKYKGNLESAVRAGEYVPFGDDPTEAAGFISGWKDKPPPEYAIGWRYGKAPQSGVSHNFRDDKSELGTSMMAVKTSASKLVANPDRSFQLFNPGRDKYIYRGFTVGGGSDGEPIIHITSHYKNGWEEGITSAGGGSKSKGLSLDQKRIHWEAYAKKTERQEEMFNRVFENVFEGQKNQVIQSLESTGKLPEKLDDEQTAKKFEPAIELVYESAFEDAV